MIALNKTPWLKFASPELLFSAAESEMAGIESEELFNDPKHQHLLDRWCAGSFGVAYAFNVQECQVAMQPLERADDVDFHLRNQFDTFRFQTVEVQRPDRRRGLEFRQLQGLAPYRPATEGAGGTDWIRAAVEKKVAKRYATARNLNLLIYANFTTEQLEFPVIVGELSDLAQQFSSVWVMTYNAIGSVSTSSQLGAVGSCATWGIFRTASYPPSAVFRRAVSPISTG